MLRIRPTSQQPYAKLLETNKCNTFAMIYKLLKLAFLLSVASASVSNLDFSPTCIKCLDPPLLIYQIIMSLTLLYSFFLVQFMFALLYSYLVTKR